jgi:hypothetical protein
MKHHDAIETAIEMVVWGMASSAAGVDTPRVEPSPSPPLTPSYPHRPLPRHLLAMVAEIMPTSGRYTGKLGTRKIVHSIDQPRVEEAEQTAPSDGL